jgi:hypothetical protein
MEAARRREDQRDEKLPIVSLPSEEELVRRKLLANYGREVRNRTRQINTLHALFVHQGHTTVVRKQLSTAERRQEVIGVLRGQEREEGGMDFKVSGPA